MPLRHLRRNYFPQSSTPRKLVDPPPAIRVDFAASSSVVFPPSSPHQCAHNTSFTDLLHLLLNLLCLPTEKKL